MKQLTLFDMDKYIENVPCPLCGGQAEHWIAIEFNDFNVCYLVCMSCGHKYNLRKEEHVPDQYNT